MRFLTTNPSKKSNSLSQILTQRKTGCPVPFFQQEGMAHSHSSMWPVSDGRNLAAVPRAAAEFDMHKYFDIQ